MTIRLLNPFTFIFLLLSPVFSQSTGPTTQREDYLSWTLAQAENIGKSTRQVGKAGGSFDTRIISTNNAINYGVRATLLTPEVIRASARLHQLNNRLSDSQSQKLVDDAENAAHLVVIVEINPNEGSGVIPLDWRVFLQPKNLKPGVEGAIQGKKSPELRKVTALNPTWKRNYEYDIFWIAFPLIDEDKRPLISPDETEVQLVVGIYAKEGRITWRLPQSIREKINVLSNK